MTKLILRQYEVGTALNTKIALVSDLHDMPCEQIISELNKLKPDIILAVGDMLERGRVSSLWSSENIGAESSDRFLKAAYWLAKIVFAGGGRVRSEASKENGYMFFEKASQIAPVVYSLGNHDRFLTEEDRKMLHDCKVAVLDNNNAQITAVNGQILNIGGLSSEPDINWLKKFKNEKDDNPKILMSHHPEYVVADIDRNANIYALVVCGHTHGGQWRIFGRGVYASGQGLFPKYTRGRFKNTIITSGCANPVVYPRIGNPQEIVKISI